MNASDFYKIARSPATALAKGRFMTPAARSAGAGLSMGGFSNAGDASAALQKATNSAAAPMDAFARARAQPLMGMGAPAARGAPVGVVKRASEMYYRARYVTR